MRVKVGRLDGRVVNLAPEHADCERAARISRRAGQDGLGAGARRAPRGSDGMSRRRCSPSSSAASRATAARVVAFSGGVDSSLVAAVAARALGPRALAVTAVSPAVAAGELDGARAGRGRDRHRPRDDRHRRARARGLPAQRPDRCYFCKTELYDALGRARARRAATRVLLSGANADDAGDWRPGLRAAAEHGVRHPLLEAGAGKARGPRARPAAAASRAPRSPPRPASPRASRTAPRSTRRRSRASTAPSAAVRALGFPVLRVRHHGILGRLEVAAEDLDRGARARATS